jgi:hypothetical protein
MDPQSLQPQGQTESIVDQITRAFSDVPQPDPALLFNHHCCECSDVSTALGGRPWPEIGLADLLRAREMALLSAEAWRYYLPAMLIWAVRDPVAMDVMVDNLVYQLEPPREGQGVPEWFAERAVGFSRDQRAAILAFLEWYRRREAADWAGADVQPPQHVHHAIAYWSAEARADG